MMSKPPICGGLIASRDPQIITPQDEKELLNILHETNFTQLVRLEDGDLVRVMANGMTEEEFKRHKQIIKQWKNEN